MRRLMALALAAWMLATLPVLACPNCKESVASSGDSSGEDDPLREAKAYNWSIYFMLAVPYGLLGTFGFVGYRLYRSAHRPATSAGQS